MIPKPSLPHALTLPTYITLVRLCVAPLILPILCAYLLPLNNITLNWLVCGVFAFFCLTDFVDGFLARYYYQETDLGKALDPIADKFLLYASLIGLLAAGKIFFMWVVLLIGRDFFMMGLRQVALQYSFDIKVSILGKLRTTIVMLYIGFLMVHPYKETPILHAVWWHTVEWALLLLSLLLTVWSMYSYYIFFVQTYNKRYNPEANG